MDWSRFNVDAPKDLTLSAKKEPLDHQRAAIAKVLTEFADHDRGKLIMAWTGSPGRICDTSLETYEPRPRVLPLVGPPRARS